MRNDDVARVFQQIADLLRIKGENVFKVRAYENAARTIDHLPVEVSQIAADGRLSEIPGVGEAISRKITELIDTGHLQFYEDLEASLPEGVLTLLSVPGIGPRLAYRLAVEMGVKDLSELEAALADGRIAALPRLGEKTAENLRRALGAQRRLDRRIPLYAALPVVEEITAALEGTPGLKHLMAAGSVRRFKETVGDVDLMGTADDPASVTEAFVNLPLAAEVIAHGDTKASIRTARGLQVDLRIVPHAAFGSLLQHFTGSKEHNVKLRERALRHGLKLSEYGIVDMNTGEIEEFADETAFYARLGLAYIPPEIRQGGDEISRAEADDLPRLVEISDVRGDLHLHTDWSDARDSLADMAVAARQRGYAYIAITDHSGGLGIAHGLDAGRVKEQIAAIETLRREMPDIYIFSGLEVDIRADGSLDLPDAVLAELDIVIASVHNSLNQPEEIITKRVLRALENPLVTILGHPTSRQMPQRPPTELDMEAVFQAARRHGKVLEINSMPNRLDLKDSHIRRARELGIKLAISSDAHRKEQLSVLRYGIGTARRGGCPPDDIINTWPLEKLKRFLTERRGIS
jgi:DNA polymerase (family X)